MTMKELAERVARERITVGSKEYRRFLPYPEKIKDGTPRCIGCGQIDEEPHHDMAVCAEVRATLRASQESAQ